MGQQLSAKFNKPIALSSRTASYCLEYSNRNQSPHSTTLNTSRLYDPRPSHIIRKNMGWKYMGFQPQSSRITTNIKASRRDMKT
jgi:hypothetical protein